MKLEYFLEYCDDLISGWQTFAECRGREVADEEIARLNELKEEAKRSGVTKEMEEFLELTERLLEDCWDY